jgi:hypothetical protein
MSTKSTVAHQACEVQIQLLLSSSWVCIVPYAQGYFCFAGECDSGMTCSIFQQFNEIIYACLAFYAGGAAGIVSGAMAGDQTFFVCVCIVLYLCAPPA